MAEISKESASKIALAMYAGEPCRICGELINPEELEDLIYAGYSKGNKSRSAHGSCWAKYQEGEKPKEEWAFPEDCED